MRCRVLAVVRVARTGSEPDLRERRRAAWSVLGEEPAAGLVPLAELALDKVDLVLDRLARARAECDLERHLGRVAMDWTASGP
jgi:hypothetical protein